MYKRFFITILLTVACAAPLSAIDRGLGNPKSIYIPQGTVSISLTGGYNSWYQENASLKVYDPFDENATDEEKADWGNADKLIAYRNDRTPTLLTVVTSSSYLGDYFTGGSGSVVYFDEFQFIYF